MEKLEFGKKRADGIKKEEKEEGTKGELYEKDVKLDTETLQGLSATINSMKDGKSLKEIDPEKKKEFDKLTELIKKELEENSREDFIDSLKKQINSKEETSGKYADDIDEETVKKLDKEIKKLKDDVEKTFG